MKQCVVRLAYKGWQTDTPGLVCFRDPRQPGNLRLQWHLIHEAHGDTIWGFYLRDQCVEAAARLKDVCDWTKDTSELTVPEMEEAWRVLQNYMTELALTSSKEPNTKEPVAA